MDENVKTNYYEWDNDINLTEEEVKAIKEEILEMI